MPGRLERFCFAGILGCKIQAFKMQEFRPRSGMPTTFFGISHLEHWMQDSSIQNGRVQSELRDADDVFLESRILNAGPVGPCDRMPLKPIRYDSAVFPLTLTADFARPMML